ncbi:uncharacterized protein LOC113858144 [Abrus precatorius]|uniref:Uncharacterized protein LOC113858144 n=1 Tax=Abrus precatorius TaxID=3816 RepID=A0A8B8KRE6_ABRPR|nr:uncharacterized protein LOC113858144 [Abrus precatorius]
MVDAVAGESFAQKTLEEARQLIEVMASNNYNYRERNLQKENFGENFGAIQQPPQPQVPNQVSTLEKVLLQLTQTTNLFMQDTSTRMANQEASMKNLENQMGQTIRKISGESELEQEKPEEEVRPKQKLVVDETYCNKTKEQILEDSCKPQILPPYVKLSYSHIPKNKEKEEKFFKFLDIFRKLHINIPFAEALEQMPSYAKFMKDLLSKKKKLKEDAIIALTDECSAILQQKLPPKLKDLGSFTIPCTIGNVTIGKALCNLRANINLMPLSILKKLGVSEAKNTRMAFQIADRSIKYPYGIMEDELVKVDKLIFPAYFVILDMDEDSEVSVILGRPFLATGRALIDVQQSQLILHLHDEKVTFKVFEAMQHPNDNDTCFRINTMDSLIATTTLKHNTYADPL